MKLKNYNTMKDAKDMKKNKIVLEGIFKKFPTSEPPGRAYWKYTWDDEKEEWVNKDEIKQKKIFSKILEEANKIEKRGYEKGSYIFIEEDEIKKHNTGPKGSDAT